MCWSVYILLSDRSGSTYVGVSTDVPRRLKQHNGELPGGARSTRAGRPWALGQVHGPYSTRAEAQRVEHRIKRLRGAERLSFCGEAADGEESGSP